MPFAAALSTAAQTPQALDEVCARARARMTGEPQLAVLFFSAHHLEAAELLGRTVRERLAPRCLLGCVGEAVIGTGREVEQGPALSLWLGRWEQPVTLEPFHLTLERTPDGPSLLGGPDTLSGADPGQAAVLLLGDPFTFPVDLFLQQVNEGSPGLRVLGGMASGIRGPGQCRLLLDGAVYDQGAVGVVLQGPLGLRSIVSQGCRPIGRHLVVTRAEDNIILELGGKPPLQRLQELWRGLSPREQQLFQQGLHIGRVLNEYRGDFQRGDFLVRNVLGLDRTSGALALTDRVRVGQTVQFHVRDADTADEDLRALLQLDLSAHERRPAAALLFSCNGRGTRLFPQPHHDAQAVRAEAGDIPLAGFFAQGELGPVGGQNFIHGFTASLALFEEGPGTPGQGVASSGLSP
jgi:small ligand-binding sensory domain FIST